MLYAAFLFSAQRIEWCLCPSGFFKSVKSDLTERRHHWKNCFWGCSNSPMMGTFANLETNELKHKNELVQVSWDVDDLLFGSQGSSSGFDTIPETITNRGEGKDDMDVLLHLHRCKACAITIKTPRTASLIHLSRQQFDSKLNKQIIIKSHKRNQIHLSSGGPWKDTRWRGSLCWAAFPCSGLTDPNMSNIQISQTVEIWCNKSENWAKLPTCSRNRLHVLHKITRVSRFLTLSVLLMNSPYLFCQKQCRMYLRTSFAYRLGTSPPEVKNYLQRPKSKWAYAMQPCIVQQTRWAEGCSRRCWSLPQSPLWQFGCHLRRDKMIQTASCFAAPKRQEESWGKYCRQAAEKEDLNLVLHTTFHQALLHILRQKWKHGNHAPTTQQPFRHHTTGTISNAA